MKLSALASMLGGEVTGNGDIEITGAAGIHDVKEGQLTFLAGTKLMKECARSRASCVLVKEFIPELNKPQIIVQNPLYAFARALEHFYVTPLQPSGISPLAFVSEAATLGRDVSVYPFAYISDNAVIGDNTVIHPGVFIGNNATIGTSCILYPSVTVREGVTIGNRVIIHSGSVIGSDGFGYVFEAGRHQKIPQVGGVIVGDDVELGANVTIDRATTGNTIIEKGTKVDNLVQIGHNVTIGENAVIVAQVGIGGSAEVGNYVILGGQVGIADHTRVDDGCMVGAQSGLMGHVKKGVFSGSPAIPHRDWLKASAFFARLPELRGRIRELEKKIEVLERRQPE